VPLSETVVGDFEKLLSQYEMDLPVSA